LRSPFRRLPKLGRSAVLGVRTSPSFVTEIVWGGPELCGSERRVGHGILTQRPAPPRRIGKPRQDGACGRAIVDQQPEGADNGFLAKFLGANRPRRASKALSPHLPHDPRPVIRSSNGAHESLPHYRPEHRPIPTSRGQHAPFMGTNRRRYCKRRGCASLHLHASQ